MKKEILFVLYGASIGGNIACGKKNLKSKERDSNSTKEDTTIENHKIYCHGTKDVYASGDYTGKTKNGKPDGNNKFVFKSKEGKDKYYNGEWKNGKKHEKGKFTLADGTIYEGEFENGYYNE